MININQKPKTMKERIEKRLEELKKSQEQGVANLNAIAGAISTLEELLKEPKEEQKDELKP